MIKIDIKIVIILILVLGIVSLLFINSKLWDSIKIYDNNIKALYLEKDSLNNSLIAYKFDINQLEYINDSLIEDLNNTRRELKIKDKQLLQMQSIKSETVIRDSIYIKDTIFKKDFISMDTTITNKWYDLKIKLEYPSIINIQTNYRSELNVFAYSNKEVLGTPKKCFLGRMFQKKHKIIRVEVIDKNPLSVIKESKFVIIE